MIGSPVIGPSVIALAPIHGVDVAAYALKGVIVFVAVVVGFRVLGKRHAAAYNVYDLVTLMAAANAVQNAITGGRGNLAVGIATSGAIVGAAFALTRIFVWFPITERVLGQPTVLISQGVLRRAVLRRQGITDAELQAALRRHGLESTDSVALAVLELDGDISIVPVDATP